MLWIYVFGCIAVFLGISAFFGAPYVPSRRRDVKRMFDELVPIDLNDVVLDIGSGDGLVLREVSRRGARAVGYEIHPLFFVISRFLSTGDPRVAIRLVNAWTTPFPDNVTVLYVFSVGRDGLRLTRKVQKEVNRIGRPIKLVCYGNPLPGITPAESFEAYFLYIFQPLHLK